MILRKKVFELLGGFDPGYFACCEDTDLCLRAWIYGFKNVYVPTSIVYHKYGGTIGKRQSSWRVYVCQKNRLINILKNFQLMNVLKGLFISIIYDSVRILIFLSHIEIKIVYSIIKAYMNVLLMMKGILYQRKIIQKNRKISDHTLMKINVIVPVTDGIKEFLRLNKLK